VLHQPGHQNSGQRVVKSQHLALSRPDVRLR
jgi:hypothetical protein